MRPNIEAVTVCVGYADIFAEVIPENRPHIDRWIVVTSPKDHATLDLCRNHNLEVVITNDFYRHGDPFNKGRAIERGLAMLGHHGWVLHLDADIALPGDFTESLTQADLDRQCLYGVDRLMITGAEAWDKFKASGFLRRSNHYTVHFRGQKPGDRWTDNRYGYVPIGFFQLWHESADQRHGGRLRRYPECHSTAARADVKFGLQWDRRHRVLLPEIVVAHLESEPCKTGANWCGRTTGPFRPAKPCKPVPPIS